MVRLGEVCNIVGGYAFKSDKFTKDGVPVIRISNLDGDKVFVDDSVCYDEQFWNSNIEYRINKNDILMAMSGATVGKIGLYAEDDKALLNQRVCNIKPIENKIDREFLYFYCKSEYFMNQIQKNAFGCAQPNISIKQLLDFNIRLGTIKFQKDVAEKIAAIFRLIEKRKQQLQKLDELVKARFVEMFGDAVNNDRGWDVSTIESVCAAIYGGGTPSKSHPEYYINGTIPWVTSKDMKTDTISGSQIYINELGVQNSSAKLVPVNSVIMVIRSGILKRSLPIAINIVPITVNQDLKVFVTGEKIVSRFLVFLFKMLEKDILTGVRAVTADNIEFDTLRKREIILPPIELQNQFADFVKQIDKSKLEVQKSLDKLETLKKALMQKYFG